MIRTTLIMILTIFSIGLLIDKCNDKKTIDELSKSNLTYQLNDQRLKDSIINKNGEIIKLQNTIVVENTEAKKRLNKYADSVFALTKKQDRKYKETIAFLQKSLQLKVTDKEIVYVDTNNYKPIDITDTLAYKEYLANSIRVPKAFDYDSNNLKINGIVNKNSITIKKIETSDSIFSRIVRKKGKGLFAKDTLETQILNKNENIKITAANSVITTQKEKSVARKIIDKTVTVATIAAIIFIIK